MNGAELHRQQYGHGVKIRWDGKWKCAKDGCGARGLDVPEPVCQKCKGTGAYLERTPGVTDPTPYPCEDCKVPN